MVSFENFIQNTAILNQLPFGIGFEIEPVIGYPTTEIAGFDIPVINELTTGEGWFFESLETLNSNSQTVGIRILRKLCKSLRKACGLETLEDANKALFNPDDQLANSDSYLEWEDANEALLDELISSLQVTQTSLAMEWVRVTYFMVSRVDSGWTFNKTATLPTSKREAIAAFITKEANGGVEPAPIEATDEAPEGKEAKLLPGNGVKSTGK